MPRSYPHSHIVDGSLVGFSVNKLYGDTYIACFRDKEGRRLKLDTKKTRIGQAIEAARILIEEALRAKVLAPAVTWDHAIERLRERLATSGNRQSTIGYYLKLIRLVRTACPTEGPVGITEEKAAAWRDTLITTPRRHRRLASPHYVAGLIGGLAALWQKWFIDDLKIVKENPWRKVEPPKTDKLAVKYATDQQIAHFYEWITERFGDWAFPKLFLSVKAHTGCRLMDLCSLKSTQLQPGRLVFPANLTKGRKERAVPMPDELHAAVDAFKGKTWLWENYLLGLRAALSAKGYPTHQMMEDFAPHRLYFWIEGLFSDYRKANKDRPLLTTHMFRKRAFTMAWQAGIDVRHASIAYGCNVDTVMQHYVALDEQQVTDEVFARMRKKDAS